MIGALRGTVLDRGAGEVLLDVQGVCYRVLVTPTTVAALHGSGTDAVLLHTHLHVREDALTLYGFFTRDERACFEALLGAHGVGPALAMAILAVHRPDALREAVASDDADALCLVPGVGKKTVVRLLLELKSRLDVPEGDPTIALTGSAGSSRSEVREALAALGYAPDEIQLATKELPVDGDVQLLLKDALGRLAMVAR